MVIQAISGVFFSMKIVCFNFQQSEINSSIQDSFVPLSHPTYLTELFTPHGQTPTTLNFKYTEAGLAKLMLFSTFIRTQPESTMDFIAKELKKYPYTLKNKLQVQIIEAISSDYRILFSPQEPYLRSFEVETDSPEFHLALTDSGMCQVYNGNSLKSTYNATERTEALWESVDTRGEIAPKWINGSGKIYQKTFWLDIGDRYKF